MAYRTKRNKYYSKHFMKHTTRSKRSKYIGGNGGNDLTVKNIFGLGRIIQKTYERNKEGINNTQQRESGMQEEQINEENIFTQQMKKLKEQEIIQNEQLAFAKRTPNTSHNQENEDTQPYTTYLNSNNNSYEWFRNENRDLSKLDKKFHNKYIKYKLVHSGEIVRKQKIRNAEIKKRLLYEEKEKEKEKERKLQELLPWDRNSEHKWFDNMTVDINKLTEDGMIELLGKYFEEFKARHNAK